jgi:branched-chain amino acid transport system substrate-binding protein
MINPEKATKSSVKHVLVPIWRFLNRNVLTQILSAMISIIIVARVTNWWTGSQSYKVYVVGSFNPSEETTQEVWQGFTAKGDLTATLDGVRVTLDRENDAGDPKEAQKVAAELARRSDTLMVVGHLLSTPTQAALPTYLDSGPPIPVILATETNPTLLRSSNLPPNSPDDEPFPAFRLSPTDDDQATIAADFAAGQKGAENFWIVKDTGNPTYSNYLASEFQNRVVADGKHVVMTTTTDTSPNPDELKARNIDWVFFAGDESHAMVLIDQIRSVPWVKKPRIMLSDWSVGPNLLPKKGVAAEGVFLTHPLPADVYNKDGYKWYGRQAREIVEHLIKDANLRFSQILADEEPVSFFFKRILSIHRVGDARTAIKSVMNERHTFQTPDVVYKFDHEGKSEASKFHIWQIQNQKFVGCEENGSCK